MKFCRMAVCAVCLGTGGGLVPAHADELTRQLQEELRRRYQYFGEIDGRPSAELAAALKNFQKRKGIPLSGLADETTTRSLGIGLAPARIASGPPLPDIPVLRSDAAREISEADQEFLRNLKEGALVTPSLANPEAEAEVARPAAEGLELAAVETFIRNYLHAAQAEMPERELGHYADRLDYFDHGKVARSFVEKDVRRYYRRWPERKYTLLGLEVTAHSPAEATVKFRIRFELKGKRESATGQTDNTFRVRRTSTGLELIQMREKLVRS
jgi:hypothetical protein